MGCSEVLRPLAKLSYPGCALLPWITQPWFLRNEAPGVDLRPACPWPWKGSGAFRGLGRRLLAAGLKGLPEALRPWSFRAATNGLSP